MCEGAFGWSRRGEGRRGIVTTHSRLDDSSEPALAHLDSVLPQHLCEQNGDGLGGYRFRGLLEDPCEEILPEHHPSLAQLRAGDAVVYGGDADVEGPDGDMGVSCVRRKEDGEEMGGIVVIADGVLAVCVAEE